MKTSGFLLLTLSLFLFLAGCAPVNQKNSADGAVIMLGNGSVVINNVWNAKAAMGAHQQTVFQSKEKGTQSIGWKWSWPISLAVVAYPEVMYGDSPWSQPLHRTKRMPLQVGSGSMTADFDVTIHGDGIYNMAFSFWVVSALPATKDRITHEVMIWTLNNRMIPAGTRTDTMVLGGVTYDLWVLNAHKDVSGKNSNTWDYVAFVARDPILRGPLNLSSFFDYLLDKGLITRDHYVTSVEFGNEIVLGSGSVEIQDQGITIN